MSPGSGGPLAGLMIAALALGCAALLLRPFTLAGTLAVMTAVGLLGVLGPVARHREERPGWARRIGVTALGIAAFGAARALRPPAVGPMTLPGVALAMLAAVAEEAFFRRLMYGWLLGAGPALAVGTTALVFALIHIPAYGMGALPIDAAAGLLFGWQRWATGGWEASAVTHLVANLLQAR
jgi:membrane protease YdiL (CAAX protease family)